MIRGLLLTCALICAPIFGGERDLRFENFSLEQGLSQSLVSVIHQDQRGFLWFGTQNGLNRFDGYQFRVYHHDSQNPHGLSHGYVVGLAEDQQDRLWVATFSGLNLYQAETDDFKTFRHDPNDPNSIAADSLYGLIATSDGKLWMGSESAGLTVLDPQTMTFRRHQHNPDDPRSPINNGIWCLTEDDRGRVFVGTDEGLDYYDPHINGFNRMPLFEDGEKPAQLRAMTVANGRLWVGTEGGGLFKINLNTLELTRFRHVPGDRDTLVDDTILALTVSEDGHIWAGSATGLNKIDPNTGFVIRHRHNPTRRYSPGPYRMISLMVDRSRILWVGSNGGGVYKLTPMTEVFHHYTHDPLRADSLGSPLVIALHVDHQNVPWVGAFDKGLYQMNRRTGSFKHYDHDPNDPNTLSSSKVNAVYEDTQYRLWLGTDAGVNRLDRDTDRIIRYTTNPGLAEDIVVNFSENNAGLWALGLYGGPFVLNEAQNTFEPKPLYADNRQYFYSVLYHDPKGGQWVGTYENGVFYRQAGQTMIRLHEAMPDGGIASNRVISVYRDGSGILWLGTDQGLDRVIDVTSSPRIQHYSASSGLPDNNVLAILADRGGKLWLSSNRGLSRFDPVKERFLNFDVSDGLQSLEFSQASFKTPSGEMFFGGINGFNVFSPSSVIENRLAPPIVLTAFKKFNRDVGEGLPARLRQVELTHRDSVVSFEFAALDYTQPTRNRFAYKLEGFDEDWIQLGDKNDVSFTNLDAGGYTLRIKGANSQGVWNEEGLAIDVRVIPPIWKTWWAYTFYLLACVGMILSVHFFRVRELERRRRELADQVTERTLALQHKNRELETLDDIVRVINREVILEKLLDALLAEVMRLCPQADTGAFLMFDPVTQTYKPISLIGFTEEQMQSLSTSAGISRNEAMQRYTASATDLGGGVYIIKGIKSGAFGDALLYRVVPKSMIAMTVSLKDNPEGFLVLDNLKDELGFDDSDREVLIRLREHAVSAVAKARLVHELVETGEQLKNTQQDLTQAAHYAGMAEIATGLLHNVGNTLNSVNTSAELIGQLVAESRVYEMISRIADMLDEHEQDLPQFIINDERGKQIPGAIHTLQKILAKQFDTIHDEAENLKQKVHQIHEVVAGQEEHTKAGYVEEVDLNGMIENLIRIKGNIFTQHHIEIIRHLGDLPKIQTQKAKVMNILDHLTKNARESLQLVEGERRLTFRTEIMDGERVCIHVEDTGVGIALEAGHTLFSHGFTTKQGAHGFGLHYCANAINELGGRIHYQSDGPNQGARFTLEIPTRPPDADGG